MATLGSERYLRYILLLGKGGLLVLRGIVDREVTNRGHSLEELLTNNRRLFNRLHRQQLIKLFPTSSTANADTSTWDISLLHAVLRTLFWNGLSTNDQTLISDLKNFRNDTGHPDDMSMEDSFYLANLADLETCLKDLASGINQHIIDEVDIIIERTKFGEIDIRTAMQSVRELNEFKDEILNSLEEKFSTLQSMVTNIGEMIEQDRESRSRDSQRLMNMETLQSHQHEDVLDIKDTTDEIKSTTTDTNTVMHKMFEILTKMDVHTNAPENRERASKILFDHIQQCLRDVDLHQEMNIKMKISDLVTKFPRIDPNLLEEVLKLLEDVCRNPDVQIGETTLGSIRMTIKCTSIGGLLRHMEYMKSSLCKQRLEGISAAVSNNLGIRISLTWKIVPESLQSCLKRYLEQTGTKDNEIEAKSVIMPLRSTSIKGLIHIWNLFEEGAAKARLVQISEILSKTVGAEVRVSASIDRTQFIQEVLKTSQEKVEGCTPEDIWFREDSEIVTYKDKPDIRDVFSTAVVDEVSTLTLETMVIASFAMGNITMCYELLNTMVTVSIAMDNIAMCYELILLMSLPTVMIITFQTLKLLSDINKHQHSRTSELEESSEETEYSETSDEEESEDDDEI